MKSIASRSENIFVDLYSDTGRDLQSEFLAEQNDDIIADNLRFAESLFPKKGFTLCPASHTKFKYFSISCEHILGHSRHDLMKMTLTEFFQLVHPDDLPSLMQCLEFIRNLRPFDPENHRFELSFRLRNKHNEYVQMRNEHVAIKIQNGNYLYLMLFTDVTFEEKFYHVKMDIHKKINGIFLNSYTYNPQKQQKAITPRQQDIAKLVIKGFTNQEIANQLGVSIFTVKNHKQTLFRKVNVKNSIELANYVMESA